MILIFLFLIKLLFEVQASIIVYDLSTLNSLFDLDIKDLTKLL